VTPLNNYNDGTP